MPQSPLSSLFGTKIKDLYIEIFDYGFYHGPSEIDNLDSRFIGREKVREKLTSILTNNETKSGTYLVTGFRGMGKTSLVNKTLADISGIFSRRIQITRYLRIAIPLFILAIIDFEKFPTLFIWLPALLWLLIAVYLMYSDPDRNTLRLHESVEGIGDWGQALFKIFFIEKEKISRNRYRIIFQDIFLLLIAHLFAVFCFDTDEMNRFADKFWVYAGLFLVGIVSSVLFRDWNQHKREPMLVWLKKTGQKFIKNVKDKMNYSQRTIIRINLGHDELREIDILRMITRRIHGFYEKRSLFSIHTPINAVLRFIGIMGLYLFLSLTYYYSPVYNWVLDLKKESPLTMYVPSQYLFIQANGTLPRNIENLPSAVNSWFSNHLEFELGTYIDMINSKIPQETRQIPLGTELADSPVLFSAIYVDYYLSLMYHKILRVFQPTSNSVNEWNYLQPIMGNSVHEHFAIIPPHLDYFLLIYLFVGWQAIRYSLRFRYFGMSNHRQVKTRLDQLIDRLYAEITIEKERKTNATTGSTELRFPIFSFLNRNKKRYPIADIREIEAEIISILHDISRIPKVFLRPEFVFIFDELDKIDPQGNVSIRDKEAEDPNGARGERDEIFSSTERIRKRQQTIIKILSNLKHFLNTAQAKFIFIAGREMFDASLADISDRDSFIGSIFHDVIYVNSFLTDASYEEKPDVTSMTETYICNFILPPKYCSDPSLRRYDQYLKEEIFVEQLYYTHHENRLLRMQREKVIVTLQHFITYLTYRSSGAPKKITRLFEQFVKTVERDQLVDSSNYLVTGKNHRNLYLSFEFQHQYAFGLTSYLTMPFLLTISRYTKDFGDKLLVSSTFLLDHLYKYHEFSFEWRNLELTPEIIDFNKAPELRGFINQIIQYLSNNHIQEIVSSLHDLKFNNKISAEIFYLSKISEFESAAFNFTLDESLEIKNYFNRRIRIIQQRNKYLLDKEKADYVHALGTNLMLLGDLHYFDQEYAEAISHYHQAIHLLKANFKRQTKAMRMPNIYDFTLLIRNMLKLGLAFERKNSYDFAFLTYGEITSAILEVRFLNTRRFGLKEVVLSEKTLKKICKEKDFSELAPKYRGKGKLKDGFFEKFKELWEDKVKFKSEIDQAVPPEGKTLLVLVRDIGNDSDSGYKPEHKGIKETYEQQIKKHANFPEARKILGFSDEFVDVLEMLPDTFFKEDLNQRISTLEGMRLLYQPFIARLHIIESNNLGGVTISDLRRTIDEFEFLIKLIKNEEKFLVKAEFYNKLGDVFYYKNGFLAPIILERIKIKHEDDEQDFRAPITAYLCYFISAKILLLNNPAFKKLIPKGFSTENRHNNQSEKDLIISLINGFEQEDKIFSDGIARHKYLNTFANTLSELGDTSLGSSGKCEEIRVDFFQCLLDFLAEDMHGISLTDRKQKIEDLTSFISKDISSLEKAFCYFFLSGNFYIHAGKHRQYAFQLSKILYIIKYYCWVNSPKGKVLLSPKIVEAMEKGLCKRILLGMSRAYDYSQRPEMEKMKKVFNEDAMPFSHFNLSISADYREIILLFKELELNTGQFEAGKEKLLVNPYTTINSKFNRVRELDLKSRQNKAIFEQLGFEKLEYIQTDIELNGLFLGKMHTIARIFQNDYTPEEVMEFLITDSIYCNFESVRTLEIFGISFIDNHSLRGMTYFALAEWCRFYEAYCKYGGWERQQSIQGKIKNLLSQIDLISLRSAYHYERALQEFYLAIETHKESKAYRNMITNMYYLDDDFNDYYTHFCNALERYRINTGLIRKLIARAKKHLRKDSDIYEVEQYVR